MQRLWGVAICSIDRFAGLLLLHTDGSRIQQVVRLTTISINLLFGIEKRTYTELGCISYYLCHNNTNRGEK